MKEMTSSLAATFKREFASDGKAAISRVIGGTVLFRGFWRLFSVDYPPGGVSTWNAPSGEWKREWGPATQGLYSFGEDVFGNQLVFLSGQEGDPCLWNHENSEIFALEVDLPTLLEVGISDGLGWLDFYSDGSFELGSRRQVDLGFHLHWTTPLILGGAVDTENLSIVERVAHLAGHAQLWKRIGDLPLGTDIAVR